MFIFIRLLLSPFLEASFDLESCKVGFYLRRTNIYSNCPVPYTRYPSTLRLFYVCPVFVMCLRSRVPKIVQPLKLAWEAISD